MLDLSSSSFSFFLSKSDGLQPKSDGTKKAVYTAALKVLLYSAAMNTCEEPATPTERLSEVSQDRHFGSKFKCGAKLDSFVHLLKPSVCIGSFHFAEIGVSVGSLHGQ